MATKNIGSLQILWSLKSVYNLSSTLQMPSSMRSASCFPSPQKMDVIYPALFSLLCLDLTLLTSHSLVKLPFGRDMLTQATVPSIQDPNLHRTLPDTLFSPQKLVSTCNPVLMANCGSWQMPLTIFWNRKVYQIPLNWKLTVAVSSFTILLDDAEFIEIYKHGIVLECTDGIWRRFYPHIFTYSADYPEK